MANEQNLKRYKKGELTAEQARKMGSNGGKASAKSKKKKKRMKELLDTMLQCQLGDEQLREEVKILFPDLEPEDVTNEVALLSTAFKKASMGDMEAMKFVRDTSGQKPVDKQSQTDNEGNEVPVIVNDIPRPKLPKKNKKR